MSAFAAVLASDATTASSVATPPSLESVSASTLPVDTPATPPALPSPAASTAADMAAPVDSTGEARPEQALDLDQLVAAQPMPAELDAETRCLAGAIYFESKGESLAGQLAVARVVINRRDSGRFPDGLCGVVYQRHQFSFVRRGTMPPIPTDSRDWREAVAIAQIALKDGWDSPVEGALFFHAAHVSPRWKRTRMAAIDNHIFYR